MSLNIYHKAVSRYAIFILILSSWYLGCSSYRGMGDFKTQGVLDESAPGSAPKGSPLLWAGERYNQSTPSSDIEFDWPVTKARISRGLLLGKRWHYGIDLAAPKGTDITASAPGTVIYVGNGFSGYGKLIVIEHNEHWATLYAHLNRFLAKEGDKVAQGQKIGEVGRTGRASGPHLHFEIRYNRQPVNPLMYLPKGF